MRSVSFPQVLLVAVLLAAVILAQRFAPGVGESVVSLVGVAVAWLVPSPMGKKDEPKDAGPLVAFVLVIALLGYSVAACDAFTGGYAGEDKLESEIVSHADRLDECKQKARTVRAGDASTEDALRVFDVCMAPVDGGAK